MFGVRSALALKRSRRGGGASPSAFSFVGSGAAADPSGILTSYATSGLWTRITLEDPGAVSALPDTGIAFSAPLQDLFGAEKGFVHGDLVRVGLWLEDTALPDDAIAGIVLTDGPLSPTSFGFGVRLRRVVADAGHRVAWVVNAGSSWSVGEATQSNAATRGGYATIGARTQGTIANVGAASIDAAGLVIASANTGPTPTSMTGWSASVALDTVSIFVGWGTGTGGSSGAVVRLRPVVPFVRLDSELPGISL